MVTIPDYFSAGQKVFRVLIPEDTGCWVICCDGESKPSFMSYDTEMPPTLPPMEEEEVSAKRQKTREKRKEIIRRLIDNEECIRDSSICRAIAEKCAREAGISLQSVLRYYWSYLARGDAGLLPARRERGTVKKSYHEAMKTALSKYYYSPAKMSLKMSYEMMLSDSFRGKDGELRADIPTFYQYEYFFRKTRDARRCITAREGSVEYKKNYRPVTGGSAEGITSIGIMEMDATVADIYLVSRFDRRVIGRPNIYLAVDVVSRMIAGIYVGFDESASAVLACLANVAQDKVEFCAEYGIRIREEDWPSKYLPSAIITDRGADFISDRVKELCLSFGMEVTSLPPYRPDLKVEVESSFNIIQQKYKPLLHNCGVIQKNTVGRSQPDYRLDARLDIKEFTAVVIQTVLYCNTGRIIGSINFTPDMLLDEVYPIPADLWTWHEKMGKDLRIPVPAEDVKLRLLPREKATVTRNGVGFHERYYVSDMLEEVLVDAGIRGAKTVTIAFDPKNISIIYIVQNGEYLPLALSSPDGLYKDLTEEEYKVIKYHEDMIRKSARAKVLAVNVNTSEAIRKIRDQAERVVHTKEELEEQKERRGAEDDD